MILKSLNSNSKLGVKKNGCGCGKKKLNVHKCKKWTLIPSGETHNYNRSPTVMCKKCMSFTNNLYFMHDDDNGDFYCPNSNCDVMGKTRYICLKCRKKKTDITILEEEEESL